MKSAIISVLESLSRTFSDHKVEFKVRESSKGVFHVRGSTIYVDLNLKKYNLSDFERLRIVVDALNHICEHVNLGYTKEKLERFIRETGLGELSRWVMTVVEDHYTDFVRTKKWRGLKKTRALFAVKVMESEPPVYAIRSDREAALRGLWTISYTGFAKGEDRASAALRDFYEIARNAMKSVRNLEDFEDRVLLAKEILREIKKFRGLISGELDPKIDFEIGVADSEFLKLEVNEDCDFDLSAIFEWNEIQDTDFEPSEFEKTLLENIRTLQVEMEKKQAMKIRLAKFRKHSGKADVPEDLIREVTAILEKVKMEDAFVESEWGDEINLRKYIRKFCGENVFELYYETKPADIGGRAILLAIDFSGSMKYKIKDTLIASQVLAYAAEYLNDKVAAFGFQEKPGIGPLIKIIPIKLWNERLDLSSFSEIDTFGNTPLREAIVEAGEWLRFVSARKKIAFVFTDAEPTSSTTEQVYRTVCALRATGVEVVGIGVGRSISPVMLNACFGNGYLWVPEVSELPYALFKAYTSFIDRRVDIW